MNHDHGSHDVGTPMAMDGMDHDQGGHDMDMHSPTPTPLATDAMGVATPTPTPTATAEMDGMSGMDHGAHGASSVGGSAGMMDHMMSPFLFARKTGYFVLFESAFVTSDGGFAGALIASFAFAAFATLAQQGLRRGERRALKSRDGFCTSLPLTAGGMAAHGLRMLLHYITMLIVMSMNVWLILAVVIGHGVGWLAYSVVHKMLARKGADTATQDEPDCDCT